MAATRVAGLIVILIACAAAQTAKKPYKLCVSENQAKQRDCSSLQVSESMVNCVNVVDSTDCFLKLKSGEADFGVFTAEEAILGSNFVDAQVTHELRHEDYQQELFALQTVAVVRSNHSGGLEGLRGKNYCHPGFQDAQRWTDTVLKFFEKKVVTPLCNASRPDVWDEMASLKNFFRFACRPGKWTHNKYIDDKLKQEHRTMCYLCDAPGQACTYNPVRTGGIQHSALNCLAQGTILGKGDVAYISLQAVKEYFGMVPGYKAKYDPKDFSFLCMNGTLVPLSSTEPCVWLQQPWSPVVATSTVSEALQTDLTSYLTKPPRGTWKDTLAYIILQRDYKLVAAPTTQPLKDFITRGREIPQASTSPCRTTPRLCVRAQEKEKCDWMRAAAISIGVSPSFQCVTAEDQWGCFRMLNESKADFTTIESNVGYITRHTYDLTTILFQETTSAGDTHVVGVVRKNSGIYDLASMRGKKACFPEYGGIAWVSVVESLRKNNVLVNACPYGATLGKFFSSTCAPGANDPTHDPKGDNKNANLCSLCRNSCVATVNNQNYGDVGSLRCLSNEGADIAFINAKRIKTVIEQFKAASDVKDKDLGETLSENYEVLCKDGSKQSLQDDLDDDCPFIKAVGGEIIGKRVRSKILSADFALAFLEMDDWFGFYPHNSESVFHLYETFGGEQNQIFTNTTVGIRSSYDVQKEEIYNYIELKKRADECGAAGASAILVGHLTWAVAICAAVLSVQR